MIVPLGCGCDPGGRPPAWRLVHPSTRSRTFVPAALHQTLYAFNQFCISWELFNGNPALNASPLCLFNPVVGSWLDRVDLVAPLGGSSAPEIVTGTFFNGLLIGPMRDTRRELMPFAALELYGFWVKVATSGKENLIGVPLTDIEAFVMQLGEPLFRARQIYANLYRRRLADRGLFTDPAKPLREELERRFILSVPRTTSRVAFLPPRHHVFVRRLCIPIHKRDRKIRLRLLAAGAAGQLDPMCNACPWGAAGRGMPRPRRFIAWLRTSLTSSSASGASAMKASTASDVPSCATSSSSSWIAAT